jgi:HTH-type transcriptional regulator / antitoxin HigA
MNIKPLKTEADYERALTRISKLMDAEPDTKEGDELDVLSVLVENYEAIHHPVDAPDPVQAIRFQMEHFGLKDKDLIEYIGKSGRVSEVLAYKRKLTLPMIRKLRAGLNIPTESLIQDYELKQG